jgi:NADH:ubiquinone oxidoreductase subunit 2 (subunit N)
VAAGCLPGLAQRGRALRRLGAEDRRVRAHLARAVEGLGPLYDGWADMLIVLAVLSLAIGNIVAIAQANFKRMLAYSTISHVGFILLGFIAGTPQGCRPQCSIRSPTC